MPKIWHREVARLELVLWATFTLVAVVLVVIALAQTWHVDPADGYWGCMDDFLQSFRNSGSQSPSTVTDTFYVANGACLTYRPSDLTEIDARAEWTLRWNAYAG